MSRNRLPYSQVLIDMAVRQAAREFQCRTVHLSSKRGRQYIVRGVNGDLLPILRNARRWSAQ